MKIKIVFCKEKHIVCTMYISSQGIGIELYFFKNNFLFCIEIQCVHKQIWV